MKITLTAPAKLNLYLDITDKRDDGYHNIKSVMHKISLCDFVSVKIDRAIETAITVTCSDPSVPDGKDNIAYKAAELFLNNFIHAPQKVDITIKKNIPSAAGLGGGSSDAAAVLIAMNQLFGGHRSKEQLSKIAVQLGADVPFCLYSSPMITEGVGEKLSRTYCLPPCTVLIANSGESVSTSKAYSELDEIYNDFKASSFDPKRFEALNKALMEKDLCKISDNMYNIFEEPILNKCPLARKAKNIMNSNGANAAMMSGSGPTVFGFFEDDSSANKAAEELNSLGYYTSVCVPVV